MNTTPLATLRETWFQRITEAHQATGGESGLECTTRCTGRCCPHTAMATKDTAYTVSHVAIMLPFEMDYILSKTDVAPARFRRARIDIQPDLPLDIGFVNIETPCPFLTEAFQCRVYAIRPMDCRSFPLVPVFGSENTLTFRVNKACPSIDTFVPEYQERLKTIWRNLLPHLPTSYRALYNRL